MPKTTTLRQTVTLPAKPMDVYRAYVNPKEHAIMTGAAASGEPVIGGEFTAWDGYIFGRYLELEPGKKIIQEWSTTEWLEDYPPSHFELTLTPAGTGTELVMVHSEVPAEQSDDYAKGWEDYYWQPMKNYFAKRK